MNHHTVVVRSTNVHMNICAGALAALASPLVGMLAQQLGFDGVAEVGPDHVANLKKADALANSLVVCTCVPWTLCCLLYSGLYITYRRDRAVQDI